VAAEIDGRLITAFVVLAAVWETLVEWLKDRKPAAKNMERAES